MKPPVIAPGPLAVLEGAGFDCAVAAGVGGCVAAAGVAGCGAGAGGGGDRTGEGGGSTGAGGLCRQPNQIVQHRTTWVQ